MTPARKKALQWFSDKGIGRLTVGSPTKQMAAIMLTADEIETVDKDGKSRQYPDWVVAPLALTDLGRRRLHGDDV